MWSDHSTNECNISFCDGISIAWKEGKAKIEDIKKNIWKVIKKGHNDEVSKLDIVKLFYGKESRMYWAFHDKVAWPHRKFLLFIKVCCRLSKFKFATTHAYSTNCMMDGMTGKWKFIKYFQEMHNASSVKSQLTAAHEDYTLWKELQQAFDVISRKLTVVNHSYQLQLVDDDKEYFELVNCLVYNQISIKKVKHIQDNIYCHVVHTMAAGASQLASCVKYEENGDITNSILEDMVMKTSFGHNTAALPDLTSLMLGYDRGYIFRDFIPKMVDCGARTHFTLKRCPWDPITYDQNVSDKDRWTIIPPTDIPTLFLKYVTMRTSRDNGVGAKMTVDAYRNGMGGVCMLMWTEYHTTHWDIVPRYLQDLDLCKIINQPCTRKDLKLYKW